MIDEHGSFHFDKKDNLVARAVNIARYCQLPVAFLGQIIEALELYEHLDKNG